ncbi:DUF87 domain-containing protein [Gordonia sp. TBRC 11910]|uniref:DUF87 domain-containing protein n=2 Tax=Gordonia asplenii TaxID=2725283 RepID=A0A848KQ16_9ACTN|nr:DUF87 domain-containing protein [Gordonia asplenii]
MDLDDTDDFAAWGIQNARLGYQEIVENISRVIAMDGATVMAVDQIDTIVAAAEESEEPDGAEGRTVNRVAHGLMSLRETMSRTTSVVSCVSAAWQYLEDHAPQAVVDRYRTPAILQRPASIEFTRALLTKRFAVFYDRIGFTPDYPTWPITEEALATSIDFTPRDVMRAVDRYVSATLSSGEFAELTGFTFGALNAPARPTNSDPLKIDQLGQLDRHFAELVAAADPSTAFDPQGEDVVVPQLLSAGLASWVDARPNDADLFKQDARPGHNPALHARLRRTVDEVTDAEQSWAFRAIASPHYRAVQARLEKAGTSAGVNADSPLRSLVLLRRDKWPRGAKTEEMLNDLAVRGTRFVNWTADDVKVLIALKTMREERSEFLSGWLVSRNPASQVGFLAELSASVVAGTRPVDADVAPPVPTQLTFPSSADVPGTDASSSNDAPQRGVPAAATAAGPAAAVRPTAQPAVGPRSEPSAAPRPEPAVAPRSEPSAAPRSEPSAAPRSEPAVRRSASASPGLASDLFGSGLSASAAAELFSTGPAGSSDPGVAAAQRSVQPSVRPTPGAPTPAPQVRPSVTPHVSPAADSVSAQRAPIQQAPTPASNIVIGTAVDRAGRHGIPVTVELEALRKHTAIFAGSGSGKTVLIRHLVEQAALQGVSSIVLDINNDLARLGMGWPDGQRTYTDAERKQAQEYLRNVDVAVFTPGRTSGRPLAFAALPDFAAVVDDRDEFDRAVDAAVGGLAPRLSLTGRSRRVVNQKAVLTEAMRAFGRDGGSSMPSFIDFLEELPEYVSTMGDAQKFAAELAESLKAAMILDFSYGGETADPGLLLTPPPGMRARVSVINLAGLGSEEKRNNFVNELQMALFAWIKRHPAGDRPLGGLLVLDEAQNFVPQGRSTTCSASALALASQARKYGLGLIFATQAPKNLDNRLTGNASTQFFGLLNAPAQIAAAQGMAAAKGGKVGDIGRLPTGTFYAAVEGGMFSKVKTPLCLTYHPKSPPTEDEVAEIARGEGPR